MKQLLCRVLLAGTLGIAGCDFNPTAPFEGFEGGDGATLTGRFQATGASAATAFLGAHAQAAAAPASGTDGFSVGVIVGGEEIGRVKVDNDTFTLRGLPDAFSLQFYDANGDPVGDPMDFAGVKPNQEIDLIVDLQAGRVVVVEERRTGIDNGGQAIEIEGRARSIHVPDAAKPTTGSLDVNDYHVITRDGETSIRKGNRSLHLDDLESGDQVHVRGVFEGNDVFAFEIKLQEDEEDRNDVPACTYQDPAKSNHILVCHKGKTLSVSPDAWPGHHGHGDTCGPC